MARLDEAVCCCGEGGCVQEEVVGRIERGGCDGLGVEKAQWSRGR